MTSPDPTTHHVTDFREALEVIGELYDEYRGGLWWRGQGRDWDLVPKVFRPESITDAQEVSVANTFRLRAPSRYDNCPDWDDHARWLFLMQHYRVPTRLLDWSESPLVGLYFAVSEAEYVDEQGVLWMADPFEMNDALHGSRSIFLAEHPVATELINAAYSTQPADQDTVAALAVDELDPRMMLQLGGFTIHGSPTPVAQLEDAASYLTKIIIDQEGKPSILKWLQRLGIKRRNLFPDLENLAKELQRSSFEHPDADAGDN